MPKMTISAPMIHGIHLPRPPPALLAAGLAVAAQDALPLYIRDKVAKTTAERDAEKAEKAAAHAAAQAAAPKE